MDKGAHFYKCDFQVHTPRDINWGGERAVTEDERRLYAVEFIAACRDKELNAVAITDHHDFVFYKYIKEAANNEKDSEGNPISDEEKIVVFPGMELTLGVPCQAIIIFDADFPQTHFDSVLATFSINQNSPLDSKHSEVQRLESIDDFEELHKRLDEQEFLRNRYIILPNVSEGGNSTMLRSGFHPKYKKIPCVGGYIDGSIAQLGTGNRNILQGKNGDYGYKKLSVFQTSDNRKRSFEDLGKHTTWVKWATPTAEAIRQACLADESRISQDEPTLPNIYITSLDVSNSKFMGPVFLEFNSQYNALIGGRGTGKSSALEYLRWGLCDQPPDFDETGKPPSYQSKRVSLIDKTLSPFNPTVDISFVKNQISHVVRRKTETKELLIKIGDKPFEPCTESTIREILPIQAYSQKQLSTIGVSVEELKRLIYIPVKGKLYDLNQTIQEIGTEVRSAYELKQRKINLNKVISKDEIELKSLRDQIETLRKELKGISEKDREIISKQEFYEKEDEIIDTWEVEIQGTIQAVVELESAVENLPTTYSELNDLPSSEILNEAESITKGLFENINVQIMAIKKDLGINEGEEKPITKFREAINKWKALREKFKRQYEDAKKKSSSQETKLKQIQLIEKRISELNKSLSEKKQMLHKAGDPDTDFAKLKESWIQMHKEKGEILELQCKKLDGLSNNTLTAKLKRGFGTEKAESFLRTILTGAKIRGNKIEDLCKSVRISEDPIDDWQKILIELEQLAYIDPEGSSSEAPSTPILNNNSFGDAEKNRIAEKINPNNWIDLFLVSIDDVPEFKYRSREAEYIDFSDASVGQQATAIINILLNQEGPPLVIDQPEDDLDNQVISDIVKQIWESKGKRQLIFVSHNANIVVNGDAELVACFDYKLRGDQSKGEIKTQGAIDIEEVRNSITIIMEGGETAFKLRKEKYGF